MPPRDPKAATERPVEEHQQRIGENVVQPEQKELASVSYDAAPSNDALRQRIAELEAELVISKSAEAKAQEALAEAAAAAQNALLFNTAVEEVWIGKRDDGEDMWKYKIDLSPSGGVDVRINGVPYYHGEVYTFDTPTLRTVKEIVQRTWDHERNIHGNNENMYRREMNVTLSGRGRR
jgi:hypothetical protein